MQADPRADQFPKRERPTRSMACCRAVNRTTLATARLRYPRPIDSLSPVLFRLLDLRAPTRSVQSIGKACRQRKKHDVLMTSDSDPEGGEWNFDADNRESFKKDGPGHITPPHSFRMDALTEEVCDLVEQRFGDHPGKLDDFCLPVTHSQSMQMLRDFVDRSLPMFGKYEDAMWTDEAFVYHSRLSAPLNVKLLDPRTCVDKAIEAYRSGDAPLNSVEGFVRQILGWREFVRGVYDKNYLHHQAEVPIFFGTAKPI